MGPTLSRTLNKQFLHSNKIQDGEFCIFCEFFITFLIQIFQQVFFNFFFQNFVNFFTNNFL